MMIANLVQQISTSQGTGALTLASLNGRQSFYGAFGTGGSDMFFYFISHASVNEWEVGTGHLSDATTLVRDTVIASSNANALVNFSAGDKYVVNDVPASMQEQLVTLSSTLAGKVSANSTITGSTKTKITYDGKGLITAGADATTADIADSANKRYVSDAQLTILGNTSGTNTGDQTNVTGNAGTVTTINGRITAGTNVTITGSGTAASPYNISSTSAAWGSVSGTLSSQTDLQTALDNKQAADATLTALAAHNTNGLLTQTAADTFTGRTLTAGSAKISVTNGNGVSGNPTVDLGTVTTAHILASTDKNYVTDTQLTILGNTSGTNTGNQNVFSTIAVSGQSDVVADSTTDTLTLVAGSNITITTNAATDTITIAASTGGGGSGRTHGQVFASIMNAGVI